MSEYRRPTVYSDPDPDSEIELPNPDESSQVVGGVIKGEPFTRNRSISTPRGKTMILPTQREVQIVQVYDEFTGDVYNKPYNPSLHGEQNDLASISMNEYFEDSEYAEQKPAMRNTLKSGASQRVYDSEKQWRENGGNPDFKMPKQVYQPNKLR